MEPTPLDRGKSTSGVTWVEGMCRPTYGRMEGTRDEGGIHPRRETHHIPVFWQLPVR